MLEIPGVGELRLKHLMLDVNGTLSDRGALLRGVKPRLRQLGAELTVHLVSSDTYGTLEEIAHELDVRFLRARSGEEKLGELDRLGRGASAVIGNGANDALVLEAAALGIAVVGPEGLSRAALLAADVICASANDALDLLLEPTALKATLRP